MDGVLAEDGTEVKTDRSGQVCHDRVEFRAEETEGDQGVKREKLHNDGQRVTIEMGQGAAIMRR